MEKNMKFARNTHDEHGNVRKGLPRLDYVHDFWPTCDVQMIRGEMTIPEIYEEHQEYDRQWEPEGYGFSMAMILEGLAVHLRLGTVRIVEENLQR
jgi:hypothetical protein